MRRRDSEVWSPQIHTSFVPLPTGGSLRKQLMPRLQAPSKIALQTDKYRLTINDSFRKKIKIQKIQIKF